MPKNPEPCRKWGEIRHYNVLGKSVRSSGGLYQLVDFFSLFHASFIKSKNTDPHYWQHTLGTTTQNKIELF